MSVTNDGCWETFKVRFGRFESLPTTNENFSSTAFTCFGDQWRLRIFPEYVPFGFGTRFGNSRITAISLRRKSGDGASIDFSLSFGQCTSSCKRLYSDSKYALEKFQRSTVLENLEGGALLIEVRMKLIKPTALSSSLPFIPKNPFFKLMVSKFMDEKYADVVFEVGGEQDDSSPVIFHAHRLILAECAPMLAELAGSGAGGHLAPIVITDVKPDTFRHALCYAYGGKVSEDDLKANAKEIIDVADKYEVVNLKLEAEAILVTSITFTVDNIMDLLLYANDKNCALLKEAAIDFIVENGDEILEKVSLKDVPGGLCGDFLTAMTRNKKKDASKVRADCFTTMRVSDLRKKLYAKGLHVDGSRESMIATLKENL